jgi:hypothetical protein
MESFFDDQVGDHRRCCTDLCGIDQDQIVFIEFGTATDNQAVDYRSSKLGPNTSQFRSCKSSAPVATHAAQIATQTSGFHPIGDPPISSLPQVAIARKSPISKRPC